MRYAISLLTPYLLLIPVFSFSQNFEFNENCKAAYHELFSLRLAHGKGLITGEQRQHPDNLIPLLLENYADLLPIIITEDENLLTDFKSSKNARINALKKGNPGSPWFLFTQAEIHLQYSLAAILFREYVSGVMDLRKAYSLLEQLKNQFPDFKPGQKSYYMIQSLLGVIPEKYNWALRLLGLYGNLEAGMQGLKKLTSADWGSEDLLKNEAVLTHAVLLLHLEGDRKNAWEAIRGKFPVEGNLFTYYQAIKVAVFSYHNEEALSLISKLPMGSEYATIPFLDYYKGLAHLQNLDKSATTDFEWFLQNNGSKNMIKSAYHKIGWMYLIKGNLTEYNKYLKLMKENGIAQAEADRQAQRESENPLPPHPELLKARLLFDGGYFEKALQTLENIPQESLTQQYQLELVYRQARIFDEMGDTVRAIERYLVTLNTGRKEPYYYAANAALNLGLIYEAKSNYGLAKEYFMECMKMDNHEYKNSLNQKAKAGLQRVEDMKSR